MSTEPTTTVKNHEDDNGTNGHRIVEKMVRHTFTDAERHDLGATLARSIGERRVLEAECDQVKASYKARLSEVEAKVESVATDLSNGFDYRNKPCVVLFKPKDRKKFFIPREDFERDGEEAEPAVVEEMTQDDYQADLIEAESVFESREEIQLFPVAGADRGVLAIGRLKGKWFTALRIRVGRHHIDERLDTEQRSCKLRQDAVNRGAKRASDWLLDTLGKDAAAGFKDAILNAVEAQKEREE